MLKTAIALILLLGGLLLGIRACRQVNPPLPEPQAPPAALEARRQRENLREGFHDTLQSELQLSDADRERLTKWMQWRAKGKSPEERKAHRQELEEILDADQRRLFMRLLRERGQDLRLLQEAQEERLKDMIGEGDFEREQRDRKLRRQIRTERLEAQRAAEEQP